MSISIPNDVFDESARILTTSSLKELKEAFVTGHNGTSAFELFLVCLSAPIGIWFYHEVMNSVSSIGSRSIGSKKAFMWKIIFESMILLFPMVICQTNLLYPWGVVLIGCCCVLSISFAITRRYIRKEESQESNSTNDEIVSSKNLSNVPMIELSKEFKESPLFISYYRSTVMYLTFVAILAVDFRVFPRRFAKTENSGYGLMDLGAGSFVVAAGLVSSRARSLSGIKIKIQSDNEKKAGISKKWKMLKKIMPLLILGLIRLLTTKGIEYQEHVSEYGVHWNFFMTLAFLYPLAYIIPCRWESFAMLLALYQLLLLYNGGKLQDYIENSPRTCSTNSIDSERSFCWSFFAANREGILGLIGYTSIYIASEWISKCCIWSIDDAKQRHTKLCAISIILWILHSVLVYLTNIPVSRRTTNASFCIWNLAHNMTILSLISTVTSHNATATLISPSMSKLRSMTNDKLIIFHAVNQHGLILFLIANLLTGLVNICINTLEVSDEMALAIIFGYLILIAAAALALEYILPDLLRKRHFFKKKKDD